MSPRTRCPAAYVPDVEVCDPEELDPLVEFLERGEDVSDARAFPRGTVLADGRLDLCKQSIGPDGAARVLEALRGNRSITSILLGTDAIGAAGVASVGELVATGESSLETLYLGCNRIEGDAVSALTTPLQASTAIKALWLKRNPLGERGATHVASLMAVNQQLEVLDVFNCELGDRGVAEIASAAQDTLRALIVGGNGAGGVAAEAIADLLVRSSRIEDINLGASQLDDDSAERLAHGVAGNRSLRRLNIASCGIGSRGARALFEALAGHPTIEVIDASRLLASRALGEPDNAFGNQTDENVGLTLRDAPRLRSIDIRNAGVASPGALHLEKILADRRDVAFLGVSRFVSRRIRRRIAALLERNQRAGAVVPKPPSYVSSILSVYRNPPPK